MPVHPEWTTNFPGGVFNLHSEESCVGEYCVVHNPSDHPLRGLPMSLGLNGRVWRFKGTLFHPDPDSFYALEKLGKVTEGDWIHICDGGCCPHGLVLPHAKYRTYPCDKDCERWVFEF
ncbi:MAG: hypothetical protein ACOYD1_07820 [Candidatus Nanopelagicales bacterium]